MLHETEYALHTKWYRIYKGLILRWYNTSMVATQFSIKINYLCCKHVQTAPSLLATPLNVNLTIIINQTDIWRMLYSKELHEHPVFNNKSKNAAKHIHKANYYLQKVIYCFKFFNNNYRGVVFITFGKSTFGLKDRSGLVALFVSLTAAVSLN